ncbi:MAG: dihydroorotase [Candidatus Omnitrophica bacterium CG11_big_fil_rev_8_21_14_0_20_63_9]|nr:MAG: dihydroorotase [Candidatus Omnitrophica bacterium CG11_big_fil_rev_8_21_14_0_20_63_9]
MAKVLIKGGRVIDPANKRDGRFDILIDRGKIADIQPSIPANGSKVIDADGKLVAPGFVDLHTHLREPGREDKETVESGCRAAAKGGFTTVCAMPNTSPAIDHRGAADFVHQEGRRVGLASVRTIGALTKGRQGKELTDFGELFDAGCVALSDDGNVLADGMLMRRALEYAKTFERPIIQHAEDPALAAGGVMHEGIVSVTLGLRGMPAQAESVIVSRDLALAELTGGWIHFAHLSSAISVELVRQAKRRGVHVTCEVTPHHLALTHEAIGEFNTHAKVNPPLRTEEDRLALLEGLRDGTIDCIATDHAPHTDWEKDAEFDAAPFGISGLETALGVCVEALIKPGLLTWPQLVERLSTAPARIAGLEAGTLSVGAEADLTVLDPSAQWTVDPKRFVSKGRHSPFAGRVLTGVVLRTLYRGVEADG